MSPFSFLSLLHDSLAGAQNTFHTDIGEYKYIIFFEQSVLSSFIEYKVVNEVNYSS